MRYLLAILVSLIASAVFAQDWRTLSREPVGLAPNPRSTPEAMIQVYGARTLGWKGFFGVHTVFWLGRSLKDTLHKHGKEAGEPKDES